MLAKQEAEKRQEEAMLTGKPLQQAEDTELDRVCRQPVCRRTGFLLMLTLVSSCQLSAAS